MSWQKCAKQGCPHRIRAGLRRDGTGVDGQELADGRFCWRCRAKDRTNPWSATSYRVGDKIEVLDRATSKWTKATVWKVGGWRMHVRYANGMVFAIDSPSNVRMKISVDNVNKK